MYTNPYLNTPVYDMYTYILRLYAFFFSGFNNPHVGDT